MRRPYRLYVGALETDARAERVAITETGVTFGVSAASWRPAMRRNSFRETLGRCTVYHER